MASKKLAHQKGLGSTGLLTTKASTSLLSSTLSTTTSLTNLTGINVSQFRPSALLNLQAILPDQDNNGTFGNAINTGTLSGSTSRTGNIGFDESYGRDKHDFWKFAVSSAQKVSLSLSNLSADAGLALYNSAGQLITWSNQGGANAESITRWLGQGDYYALAYSYSGSGTGYRLGLSAGEALNTYIDDYTVQAALSDSLKDGIVNRNDMIQVLRSTKDGSVNSEEVADLRRISTCPYMEMADYVRVLSKKVVYSNPANANYQGGALGNLYGGASATHIENLVGKWFLGNDRPVAKNESGTTTYNYNYASGSLFQNGISHSDVDQGGIGDCYYLAALGSVAQKKASVIQNMFTDNGDGTFTVKLFKNGVADYVTVDRYLPTSGSGGFVFANNSSGKLYNDSTNELWVALAEKAYAQINEEGWIGQDGKNSYQGIGYGWPKNAMEHITGLTASSNSLSTTTDVSNAYSALASGKAVTMCTPSSGVAAGIVANHCYTFTGYNFFTGKYTLYNPWGGSGASIELTATEIANNFTSWQAV